MSKEYADLVRGTDDEPEMNSMYHPGRLDVRYDAGGPSMTRQEFADECDINQIMARYEKNGGKWPPPMNDAEPFYWDYEACPRDLAHAMEQLMAAETAFSGLPATVRREFDNDPVQFVEYVQRGGNEAKLKEWGLLAPEKAPEPPIRVEVTNPSTGGPPSSSSS